MAEKVMIVLMVLACFGMGILQNAPGLTAASIALGYFLNMDFVERMNKKRKEDDHA
jgi:hypothetical protein